MIENNSSSLSDAKIKFNKILEEAKNDKNILAFWLSGSRGKGMVTEHSDYDCNMIVTEEVFDEYKNNYENIGNPNLELSVMTLAVFRKHAEWGSDLAWDRYNFYHINALVDKTGEIQRLFDEKSIVPNDKIKELVSGALDAYINQMYRSLKCFRDANPNAGQLEGSESVSWLLIVLFGIEGRIKPYYKYLEWDLKKFSLKKLPWSADEFIKNIMVISTTADVNVQREIFNKIEPVLREAGYGEIFDGWKEKIYFIRGY